MSLANDYKRQFEWRDWPTVLGALPQLDGQKVIDLGCGVGDLSAELVARGAHVIGIDANEELLGVARARQLPNAEFRLADLRSVADLGASAHGLWCSFTAAYFPDLPTILTAWARNLKSGGFIALVEIDDLFGHEPLGVRTKELLTAYAENSLAAGRYDFHMGRKLRDYSSRSGFTVSKAGTLEDHELSFRGSARPEVLEAWRNRFERMRLLREFCGSEIARVQEDFLACLTREDHVSLASVHYCIATR